MTHQTPLAEILRQLPLTAGDLVDMSTEQLTYKQVSKAVKGKAVTANIRAKILRALNACAGGKTYTYDDVFPGDK